jgi:hypothetical protein
VRFLQLIKLSIQPQRLLGELAQRIACGEQSAKDASDASPQGRGGRRDDRVRGLNPRS